MSPLRNVHHAGATAENARSRDSLVVASQALGTLRCLRLEFLAGCLVALAALLSHASSGAEAVSASSARYTISHRALDQGGGRTGTSTLTFDTTLGGVGGICQTADGRIRFELGRIGFLNADDPLNSNQVPTLSAVPNQNGDGGSTPVVNFTVADRETPAADLSLSATSSNPALIPNSSIHLGGSGANRNVQVLSAPGKTGTSIITLMVTDAAGGQARSQFTVTVNVPAAKLNPAVTWAAPAAITYGVALGLSQLNATAAVPGTFAYTPASGTKPNAGTVDLSVTFSPSDAESYETITRTVSLTVAKAPLTIRAENKFKREGDALPTLTASYTGFVNQDTAASLDTPVILSTTATASSPSGTYPITATGASDGNYTITHVNGTLTVTTRLLPAITWSNPAAITYGTPLGATQLNPSADAAGSFSYNPPLGTILAAGPGRTLSATFTPNDILNFEPITAVVEIQVLKAPLTIRADDKSKVYGAALPAFTATLSGLVNGDTADSLDTPVSFATGATASSNSGTYTITPSGATDVNYSVTFESGTLTVTKAPLTIRAEDKNKVYGAALPTLTASYSGFVNQDTTASLDAPVSLSTTAAASSNVGSYPITASAATDANYTITFEPGILTVAKAPLTIRAEDKFKREGDVLPVLTAVYSGFVNQETVSSLDVPVVLSTTASASSAVGSYPITASGASDANYTITHVNGTLTVTTKLLPNITWSNPAAIRYGTALSASQLNAVSDAAGSFSYNPPLGTVLPAGQGHSLSVTFTPNDTVGYESVTKVMGIDVVRAPLTIRAEDKTKVYGAALPVLTASYSGFVNGESASSLDSPVILSTTGTASSNVGSYSITASAAADANYTITFETGTLTVSRAPLTIRAEDKTKVYGAALPVLTASYSGFVNGESAASLDSPVSLSTTGTASSNVGSYPITASAAADANYTITFEPGTLTVSRAPLTIRAEDKTKVSGAALPVLTASYSGFVNGDNAASLDSPVILSTSATASSDAGTYPITASGASDANYTVTHINGTLTMTARQLPKVTWSNPAPINYGTPLGTVQLNASADVAGSFSYNPPSGTVLAAGQARALSVSFAPNDAINYESVTAVIAIDVLKVPLTVRADDKSKAYGAALPVLTASYSGFVNGDTVVSLDSPVSLSTSATASSNAGSYAITASGASDANYTVNFQSGLLTVTKSSQIISFSAVSDRRLGDSPVNLEASSSSGLPVSFAVAGPASLSGNTLVLTGPGTVTVTASQPGDINFDAALSIERQFTVVLGSNPPAIEPITAKTTAEGVALTFTVRATDPDVPANTLSFSLGAGAPVGAAISPTTGVFTWTPLESQGPGTFNITVQVSDNAAPAALTDSKMFSVTVSEVNQAPSLSSIGAQSVTEGNRLTLTASASDPDFPANAVTYSLINGPPTGAAINPSTGVFTWSPAEAQGPGSFTISIQATDDGSPPLVSIRSFTVTVNEANAAPVLSPISNQTVRGGETMTVPVSASDPDVPANVLTFSLEPGAPAGALIDPATGVIQWAAPASAEVVSHEFRVRVTDNGTPSASVTKTFTVVVNASNQAPQIPVLASQNVDEGKTLSLTVAATDPDQPPTRLTYALGPNTLAGLSINPLSGVLNWTPSEGQGPSTNSITVRVTDAGVPPLSAERVVVVTVNEVNAAPVMTSISSQTVVAGKLLSFPVLVTDQDLPKNIISFRLAPGAPVGASVHPATGVFTWTPTLAQGATTNVIGIIATDEGVPNLSDTKSFTVVVTSPNTAPALDPVPDQTIGEGSALTVILRARDADQPQDQLTYSLRSGAPAGVSVNPNTGVLTWTPTEAQGPSTNRIGVAVTDSGLPPLSNEQEIVIIVREVNAPPVIGPTPDQTVKEGELLTLTVSANDPDVPANAVQFSLSGVVPAGMAIDPASSAITWRPTEAQGPSTNRITIVATDNGTPSQSTNRVLTVIVTEENVPPILQPIAARTVNEGSVVAFTAVASDSDQPLQKLTFSLGPGTPAGVKIDPVTGAVSWITTESDGPSTNSIRVRVTDDSIPPQSAEQSVVVVVGELNTAPTLGLIADQKIKAGEPLSFTVTASDPDLPANAIAFSLGPGAPLGASIDSVTGVFRWTPSVAQSPSTNLITIIATDNGTPTQSASRTFTVVALGENSPPVLTFIPAQSTAEGSTLTFTAAAADFDLPAQTFTFSLGPGAPIGAAINPVTGVFTWTPSELQGPSTNVVVVRVTDSGTSPQSATQNVSITVTEVNTAPVLSLLSDQTIAQGDTLKLSVAATDADLPANRLSFSLDAGAPAGATIDPANGAFTWTPAPAQTPGTNRITIRVTDNGSPVLSDSKSFSIFVRTGVNLLPSISTIANQTTKENTPAGPIVFTINDPDTPLSNLKVLATSSNTNLVPDVNIIVDGIAANRTAVIQPLPNKNGTARITITVVENTGASASASFDLTVTPVPPAITRQPQNLELIDGSQATFSVLATGSPPLAYQWRFNGVNVPGATNSTLTLSNVQESHEGIYTVEVRNSIGAITSAEAKLSADLPLGIRLQPVSQSVLAGADVTFSVGASGRAPLTYQWRFNGAAVPGATGSSLELRNVDATRTGDYITIVSNASGSLTSAVAKLEVKVPVVILTPPRNQIVPLGTTAAFSVEASGTPPLSYQWRLNGLDLPGRTNAALTLANVSAADAGDYAVAVGNASGSIVSAPARLTVSVAPAIARQPQSQAAVTGANVTFNVSVSGTEPLTYQWRFNGINIPGAPNAPTYQLPSVQTGAVGDYSVVISNAAGVATSDAAALTVTAPVTFVRHPQSESVNAGESVTLFFLASGSGPSAVYQWRFNGVDIPGATRPQLALAKVRSDQAGRYTVVIRNAAGPVESNAATLSVNIPVTITQGPQSQTVVAGSSAVFTVSAAGTSPITYQWRLNGVDLPGRKAAVLELSNVQKSNAGSYTVVVRNVAGEVTSASANLEVLAPPSIQTHPSSQNVPPGADVTFSVVAGGDLPLSYQWQKNGVNLAGATNSTLSRSNVQVADAGNYTVVVENRGGAVTSDSASLTLILPPLNSGNSAQTAPAPIESVEGSFDGGSNEAGLTQLARKSVTPTSERWYAWRAPSNGIATFSTSGSTFDTVMTVYQGTSPSLILVESDDDRGGFLSSETRFNAAQGTTYLIKVEGFGGATGRIVLSFKLQVTELRLPIISSWPQSQSVSAGANVILSVAAQGTELRYQWLANGVSIPNETRPDLELRNVQEKDVAQYSVRVTSGSGANQTSMESLPASLQIGASGVAARDKFKQALAAGDVSPAALGFAGVHIFSTFGATREQGEPNHCDVVGEASRWFLNRAPQNGTIRVSTEGSDFDTLLAIYTGAGTDFETLKVEGCDNNGGADGKTSVVKVPAIAGRLYFIAVDGVNGAAGRVRLSYEFGQTPLISGQPESLMKPDGADVSFSVSTTNVLSGVTTNVAALSYQWLKDGVPLAGETKAGLNLRGIKVENAGGYSVIVSNFAGAVTSIVARLTVIVPIKFTSSPQNQTAKAGESVLFTALASGTAPVAYQWKRNGLELPGETNSTLRIKSVLPNDAGSYQLVARNAIGAAESLPAALSIIEAPVITEAPRDETISSGSSVTFRVRATGTDPLNYQWRFNGVNIPDATTSSLVINNAQPVHIGEYAVVVSNPADAVVSPVARLAVRVPATLTSAPRSQAVNSGSSAVFNVTVSGSGPFAYQWRFNGADIPGATNSTFVVAKAQLPNAGNYTVLVSTDKGVIESAPGTLTVNEVPIIVRQPVSQSAFVSGSVSFSVTAEGSSPLAYQWLKNSQPIAGATANTLSLDNLAAAAAGLYSVTVSNAAGTVDSTVVALEVRPVVSEMEFASGVFRFELNVPEGKQARVQSSSDFITWVDFMPGPIAAGTVLVEEKQPSALSLRFYRIVIE